MRVIFDHVRPSGRIMPVMQVIEAQSARSWGLTITSITNMSGCGSGRRNDRVSLSVRRASSVSRAVENGLMSAPDPWRCVARLASGPFTAGFSDAE